MQQQASSNIAAALKFSPASERTVALKVTLVFLGTGAACLLLSDLLLWGVVKDPVHLEQLYFIRGWVFVAVAGLLIYFVTRRVAASLVRARRTIAAIIESIGDGVLLIGPRRTILHANGPALQILHADSLRDVVGMDTVQFGKRFRATSPDGTPLPLEKYLVYRAFEEPGPLQQKLHLHPQGHAQRVLLATAAPVRTSVDALPDLVVSVLHDVTELERIERMRDEFISVAAHSMKTPVAILKSSAQLLRRHEGQHPAKAAAAIERQCARLARLTDNLLVLSRLRSGALHVYPSDVDLALLVERVAAEAGRLRPGHPVNAEARAGLTATVDEERIILALRNVVDEALRWADGHGPVTVVGRRSNGDVELGVRYEPRTPEAEESVLSYERYDNLGLRRYVTKSVLEAHGGLIREETAGRLKSTWLVLPS